MKKHMTILILCFVLLLSGCSGGTGGYTSDRDCEYCGTEPTKMFTTANGTECYVCERCSTSCFMCGGPVSKQYTNGFDQVVFACDDCYAEIANW